jgi:hypothetical protein
MVSVKTNLTRTEIVQILNEPKFYTEVPAFLFMRDQGYAASCQYLLAVGGPERLGGGEDKILEPAMQSFLRMVREICKHAPDQVALLKKFVSQRLGYTVERLVVYYMQEDGEKAKLEF